MLRMWVEFAAAGESARDVVRLAGLKRIADLNGDVSDHDGVGVVCGNRFGKDDERVLFDNGASVALGDVDPCQGVEFCNQRSFGLGREGGHSECVGIGARGQHRRTDGEEKKRLVSHISPLEHEPRRIGGGNAAPVRRREFHLRYMQEFLRYSANRLRKAGRRHGKVKA